MLRRLTLTTLAASAALALPAAADAAQRYASQTGAPSDPCTAANPCDVVTAINAASANDEIIINPGVYTVGANNMRAPAGSSVHGVAGATRPLLVMESASGLDNIGENVRFRDIRITMTGGGFAFSLSGDGSLAERIEVTTTGDIACSLGNEVLLRDSMCINRKPDDMGGQPQAVAAGGFATATEQLRNVTAVSTGQGSVGLWAAGISETNTIDARNLIASGVASDIAGFTTGDGEVHITLAFSNWDSVNDGGSVTYTTTPIGAPTNQTEEPIFFEPGDGNFRQDPTSPTVDAGAVDAYTGALDFEGDARPQGAAIDIGADELDIEEPPVDDTTAPETTITKHPKKKTTKRKAVFAFEANEAGSTFECKLDKKPYKACTSPRKYKRLKRGKHKFSVRATDAAGNTDATPATYRWKVKKRR